MQAGEELPVLVDEVDQGVRRRGELGEMVRVGVESRVGAVAQAQTVQAPGAGGGLLVLGGEQQPTGRTRRVVPHGRAPSLWTQGIYGLRGGVRGSQVCGDHMWAPWFGACAGA